MRLRISDGARHDLRDLHAYGVDNYGQRTADEYLDVITLSIERLVDWPLANRLRRDVHPPVRLLAYAAHNIFYDVLDDEVLVIRILHHTADWPHEL